MINPTGYTALDLVGFTDKGTYASNVNYVKNDIVHYGGNLWKCKIDDTMNVTPAEGNNWTVFVGEPTNLVERIIAPLEENPATVAYATGRQIIYDDWLWEVIDDIAVGDPLIDYAVDPTNANIKKAAPVETQLLDVKKNEGNLTDLHTTNKTNLVAAVNEVKDDLDDLSDDVGNLSSLDTTVKTSAVAAINEVNTKVSKTEVLVNNAQQMIAPIEANSSSASRGYAIGEQFILSGLLCEATSTIAQNDAFVLDGNYKLADSVTEQINSMSDIEYFTMNAVSMSMVTFNIKGIYHAINKTVTLYFAVTKNVLIGTTMIAVDMPVKYRPQSVKQGIGLFKGGSASDVLTVSDLFYINPQGELYQSATSGYMQAIGVVEYQL